MGFVLTLIYLFVAYMTPTVIFGDLAEYHIEIILALLAVLASVPNIPQSGIFKTPQSVAIGGMLVSIFASFVFAGLIREAPEAFYDLLPNCLAFFLVALNCRTRLRLQLVVAAFFCGSVYIILQGSAALSAGLLISPYLFNQGYEGHIVQRLKGLGFVNDPNDLAQVFVSLLPCLFLFAKPKKPFWNLLVVWLPSLFLLYGVFLTHSRGSMVALMAIIGVTVYRRFGLIPAGIMAGATFALASALSWSGGREVSVESGSDRMEAWSTGLQLIRSHPIFGVGYHRFTEYYIITAHNSIVVCAAELGIVGFFFWVLFVVGSMRKAVLLKPLDKKKVKQATDSEEFSYLPSPMTLQPATGMGADHLLYSRSSAGTDQALAPETSVASDDPFGSAPSGPKLESEAGIRQMAWVMAVCLTGFLTAGWFLSRSYVMWLFMYGGMIQAIYHMAVTRGVEIPPTTFGRIAKISAIVATVLLLAVYVILRVKSLFPSS